MRNNYELQEEWALKLYDIEMKSPWANKTAAFREEIIKYFCIKKDISESTFYDIFEDAPLEIQAFITQLALDTFLEQCVMPDNTNIIDTYIKRFKFRISRDALEYYQELRSKTHSIYKITEIKSGEYVILKDLLLDIDNIKVIDDSSSEIRHVGQKIFAKIVSYKNENYFAGITTPFKGTYSDIKKNLNKKDIKNMHVTKRLQTQSLNILCKIIAPIYEQVVIHRKALNMHQQSVVLKIKKPEGDLIEILNNLEHKDIFPIKTENIWYYIKNYNKSKTDPKVDCEILADMKLQNGELICSSIYNNILPQLFENLKKDLADFVTIPPVDSIEYLYDNEDFNEDEY